MSSAFAIPAAVLVAVLAAGASAQEVVSEVGHAADPDAPVPPARYESAFGRYRPMGDTEIRSWREVNDRVGRLGGWRTYGREAISDENKVGDRPRDKESPTTPDRRSPR